VIGVVSLVLTLVLGVVTIYRIVARDTRRPRFEYIKENTLQAVRNRERDEDEARNAAAEALEAGRTNTAEPSSSTQADPVIPAPPEVESSPAIAPLSKRLQDQLDQ
jgi:cytoskeletal protein RodZ